MKRAIPYSLLVVLLFAGCNNAADQSENWLQEIADTEEAFSEMARTQGIPVAFEYYADEEGAIKRGKKVIKGKSAIRAWYEKDTRAGDTLLWTPTFIDVSASGDLGYTYGDYRFIYLDSLGNQKESTGIFHTVWKRQPDGQWRYVWD